MDEKAAAAWANTPAGKLALSFDQAGDLHALAECARPGWAVETRQGRRICFVKPDAKGQHLRLGAALRGTGAGRRGAARLCQGPLAFQAAPPVKQPFVRPGAAGSRAWSKGRDAFRPDPSAPHRRAVQGQGGAASRRDRSHAQPRAAPPWARAWRAWRGPTPGPERAPGHADRANEQPGFPQKRGRPSSARRMI